MAGPAQQSARTFIVPPGEAQVQFSAESLAFKIQNLERTTEGTLASVLGPTPYEPQRERVYVPPTTIGSTIPVLGDESLGHGSYHAVLLAGQVGMLLIRVDNRLFRHAGWVRGWEVIEVGLSTSVRPEYPDQFTVLNDKIIWTNGVDQARIIEADGSVGLLGFTIMPSTPVAEGPQSLRNYLEGDARVYPNHSGYSWEGKIGTPGDLLDGIEGAVLAGAWYYYVQLEDSYGNLSATSGASNPVSIETIQASPINPGGTSEASDDRADIVVYDATIDDLMRQFIVHTSGDGPDNCTAIRLYRTPDTKNVDIIPRFLTRLSNNRQTSFPDSLPDSALGSPMVETVPTPIFRIMCTHQGRLVIANIVGAPGLVRRSDVGFPGTFPKHEYIYPDSGGSEVTGIASHSGYLLAFTRDSVYSLEEFSMPRPMTQGIGCVAPRSLRALTNGLLVWLSHDGFYGMVGGSITKLSTMIDRTIRYHVSRSQMRMAVATVDALSGEYRCALAPAGGKKNSLVLCFDGVNWRRQDVGIDIIDWCQLADWRQYTVALGKEVDSSDVQETSNPTLGGVVVKTSEILEDAREGSRNLEVYVMGRATKSYTPPDRDIIYRSGWLRADGVGLTPINVRTMYVGMVDAWDGDYTVTFYRNGSWSTFVAMSDIKALGTDDESNVLVDIAGSAVIGTAKVHDRRMFWRQIPVGIENASSWAFEIRTTYPTRLNLAAFAFDVSVATGGNVRGRIPMRDD